MEFEKVDVPLELPLALQFNYLKINASSLAAFCDRHKYKTQPDAFVEVLQRNAHLCQKVEKALDEEDLVCKPLLEAMAIVPKNNETVVETFKKLVERKDEVGQKAQELLANATPVTEKDVQELRIKRPRMQDLVHETQAQIRKTSEYNSVVSKPVLDTASQQKVQESSRQIIQTQVKDMDQRTLKVLNQNVESTWLKDRGTVLEETVVEDLLETCPEGCQVVNQSSGLIRINIGKQSKIYIPCKMDLMFTRDGRAEKIVEIKNRRNHFFVPGYDLDQLCLYMIATKAKEGVLVEKCQGEQRTSFHFTPEAALERFQREILPSLSSALGRFSNALEDPMSFQYRQLWENLRGTRH